MSNLEHYFENLLYEGLDYEDEINKRHLTPEEIEAVKTCAEYITYTFFNGKDELKKYINGEIDVIKTGKWIDIGEFIGIGGKLHEVWKCDCCGFISYDDSNFCPQCGAKMEN